MRHSKKIVAMLLTAICLLGILPLSVYAEDYFEVGKTYYFNNDGIRSSNQGIFTGSFRLGGVFNQAGLDVDVVGSQFLVKYEDFEAVGGENAGLEVQMLLFGSGLVPNEQGIPLYYPNIGISIVGDNFSAIPTLVGLTIAIIDLEQGDGVIIYSNSIVLDSFLVEITDINYEESTELVFLASWFTEEAEVWEIGLRDILRGWSTLSEMLVGSIVAVYTELNVLSTVSIIVLASALALCMLLLIKRIFERR